MHWWFAIADYALLICFFEKLSERKRISGFWYYLFVHAGISLPIMSFASHLFYQQLLYSIFILASLGLLYKWRIMDRIQLFLALIITRLVAQLLVIFSLSFFTRNSFEGTSDSIMLCILQHVFCIFLRAVLLFLMAQRGRMQEFTVAIKRCISMILVVLIVECLVQYQIFQTMGAGAFFFSFFLFTLSLFLSVLIYVLLSFFHNESVRQMENLYQISVLEQKERHFNRIEENHTVYRKEQHDFENKLIAIRGMCHGNQEETKAEIDDLLLQSRMKFSKVISENMSLNEICTEKQKIAEEYEISVIYDIRIPKKLFLKVHEIGTLYGNLFDNAIEANLELSVAERRIELTTFVQKGMLIITMRNQAKQEMETTEIQKKNKKIRLKNNRNERGYGLKNVREVVERYQGEMMVKREENSFEIKIMLCDV